MKTQFFHTNVPRIQLYNLIHLIILTFKFSSLIFSTLKKNHPSDFTKRLSKLLFNLGSDRKLNNRLYYIKKI